MPIPILRRNHNEKNLFYDTISRALCIHAT